MNKKEQRHPADEESSVCSSETITPTQAARVFVSRVFHIPSHILPHPITDECEIDDSIHPKSKGRNIKTQDSGDADEDDTAVLFPLVGFTFVKNDDNIVQALPSANTRALCMIDSVAQTKELPSYGYYSPCCYLGDVNADDDEYCGERRALTWKMETGELIP